MDVYTVPGALLTGEEVPRKLICNSHPIIQGSPWHSKSREWEKVLFEDRRDTASADLNNILPGYAAPWDSVLFLSELKSTWYGCSAVFELSSCLISQNTMQL